MILTDRVFVFPNPTRDNVFKSLFEILDYLLAENFSIFMEDSYREMFAEEYPIINFMSAEQAICSSDFTLVIGGDGTILHVASLAASCNKPVLGINLGTMGFLSELEMRDLEMVRYIKEGKYTIDKRMMIDVRVISSDDKTVFAATGLNDATFMKFDMSKIVKVGVSVNGRKVMTFSGDGVIVCTPTGSTAYSLSAGGPILEPTSACMAVTPVCPHSLGIKSFVVSDDRVIEVVVPPQYNTARLSIDGYQNHNLSPDERVEVRRSDNDLSLIRLKGIGFYERIHQKLSSERL